jgi:hypothetical protein
MSKRKFQSLNKILTKALHPYLLFWAFCRSKARELINLLNDRQCPQSFSAEIFVKKVI